LDQGQPAQGPNTNYILFQAKVFFQKRSQVEVKQEIDIIEDLGVKTELNYNEEDHQYQDQDQDDEMFYEQKDVKIPFYPICQITLDPVSSTSKTKSTKVKKVKIAKSEKLEKPYKIGTKIQKVKLAKHVKNDDPLASQQLAFGNEEDFPVSDNYTCQQCNQKFPTLFIMSEHNYMFHCSPDNQQYQCPSCNYTCVKRCVMRQHIKQVHESVRVGCPKCKRQIREMYLRTHLENEHSDKLEKKYKCTYEDCTFSTAKTVNLAYHIKQKHKKDEHNHKCDKCDKTFVYPNNLRNHVDRTHLGLRPFVCEKCGKGYNTQILLTEHQAKPTCKQSGAVKSYKCEACDVEFSKVMFYVKHFYVVHGSQPPNMDAGPAFLCDSCPKMYLNQISLEKHRKHVHQGVPVLIRHIPRKLQCPHCEKRLVKSKLDEHIKSKHEMNTPFKCDKCTRSFGTSTVLQTHKTNLHKRVNCDLCGQNICNSFWLKRHKSSAHGITPKGSFQCPNCPLFFNLQGSLNNHLKKQHAEVT
jgi:hypothetical protein